MATTKKECECGPKTDLEVILADNDLRAMHKEMLKKQIELNITRSDIALRDIKTPKDEPKSAIIQPDQF